MGALDDRDVNKLLGEDVHVFGPPANPVVPHLFLDPAQLRYEKRIDNRRKVN